jgi:hypothetical protein
MSTIASPRRSVSAAAFASTPAFAAASTMKAASPLRTMKAGFLPGLVALALGVTFAATAARASLVSVDLSSSLSPVPVYSGVEAQAAGLNASFAAANVWNDAQLGYGPAGSVNPTFPGLLDSTGAASGLTLSITGTASAYNGGGTPLFGSYLYFNSPNQPSTGFTWTLSGLTPGATYDMVFYGANTNQSRSFDMVVDTDGNGAFGNDTAFAVVTALSADPAPALRTGITASATGTISGQAIGVGSNTDFASEGNWSGFQIASAGPAIPPVSGVPEPGSALVGMMVLGLCGVGSARRRRA